MLLPDDSNSLQDPPKRQATITISRGGDEPTESSPLLGEEHAGQPPRGNGHQSIRKRPSPAFILLPMTIVILLVALGDQLQESPSTRIFESVICYRYHERHDPSKIILGRDRVHPGAIGGVEEKWCKADGVQDELARLNGYQNFFDGFPYLLLALPFGWAADRFGRWPIIMLNLIQLPARALWTQFVAWNWQAFDLRAVWLSSVFSLLGGGSIIASNLFYVTISDVTPQEERAAAFLRMAAVSLLPNVLTPPLAAWLMQLSPWIPSLLGTACTILAALVYCVVPETKNYQHQFPQCGTPSEEPTEGERPLPRARATKESLLSRCWLSNLTSSLSFLTTDWRIPALISAFSLHILIASINRLLLQYTSKRYALTIAQGTLLITLRNAVQVFLLLVLLPYLSQLAIRIFHLCGQRKDLYLARASQVLVATGWIGVAASPTLGSVVVSLAITSLGAGAGFLTRSFLTSLLPAEHIAVAYSLISMTDTLGSMFGNPLLAELLARGLALGGFWAGLPFFFVGIVAAFFAILMFMVRLRKGEED
ncbi:hypothetical protein AC579_680 [Lecanosticta acicola]|uniref:MFS transporter n=1 Tax=Lecanosticta acicola TaxID=111012 RepID=A0AAI9E8B7_9PEZI|nr:hypothetical protein AC579_680 [Lecanosticta acicola]